MVTMQELTSTISEKAKQYLRETGENVDVFPDSVVDFVIEYAVENSNFPNYYSDDDMANRLYRCKNTLALACQEVYSKAGAEGQLSHTENGVSRSYKTAWITCDLLSVLPNFVTVPSSTRR